MDGKGLVTQTCQTQYYCTFVSLGDEELVVSSDLYSILTGYLFNLLLPIYGWNGYPDNTLYAWMKWDWLSRQLAGAHFKARVESGK